MSAGQKNAGQIDAGQIDAGQTNAGQTNAGQSKKNHMKLLFGCLPFIFMGSVLSALLFFMCLPLSAENAQAEGGALSLSHMDERVYAVNGQWEFYFGQLLSPGDIAQSGIEPRIIDLPCSWNEAGYPLHGVATYRLRLQVASDRPLLLYVPEIAGAYALWSNGVFIHRAGTVAKDAAFSRLLFENALIPLSAQNGHLELVIQVSNFDYMHSGLKGSLLLGEHDTLLKWFFRTRAFYCAAIGALLIAAFYHFTMFIFRPKAKIYLWFSLLCATCFFRFLYETNGLGEILGWNTASHVSMHVYILLFFCHNTSVLLFTLYVFQRRLIIRHRRIFAAYTLVGMVLFAMLPFNTPNSMVASTVFLFPAFLLVTLLALKSPVLRQDSWTRLYFVALLAYVLLGSSSKLLADDLLFMPGLLINMFMILAQSVVLAKEYNRAMALVEETNTNLERLVDARTADLQAANSAMKELIANISHDLKTPLSILSVNLEKLGQMTQNNSEYRRHVNIAYHKNLDLQRLLQNLFEVSRIETGPAIQQTQWLPLCSLFAGIQQKYADFLESHQIDLDVSCDIDGEIAAEPQKIWSVFDNIIYNGVRHTNPGGLITVNAHHEGNTVIISVSDTGCGIGQEHLPHIFERFYKASPGRGSAHGESGLGLYIVKSLMLSWGGSVSAQSPPGKGAEFFLTFRCK